MAVVAKVPSPTLTWAPPDDRERLRNEIIARAVKLGEGIDHQRRPMPWILDMREVLLTEPGLGLATRLLWEHLRDLHPDVVAGVGVSGTPLVAGLVIAAGASGARLEGAVVRKEQKAYGRGRRVEGPRLAPGARAVIVDDVVNSGATVDAAARALGECQVAVVGVAAVVDLQSPRSRRVAATQSVAIRSLFTATDLGFGVRLPSHRRVPVARWVAPIPTEPDATVTAMADGYVVASGDRATAVNRDGVVTRDAIARRRPLESWGVAGGTPPRADTTRLLHSLTTRELHIDIADDGTAWGVDRSTGKIHWTFRAGRRLEAAPALCRDLLVFATTHRFAVAVDAASGMLRWTTNLGATARTSPCVVDARTLALIAAGDVCLVDAAHGELLWWRGGAGTRAVASAGDGRFAVLDGVGLTEYASRSG